MKLFTAGATGAIGRPLVCKPVAASVRPMVSGRHSRIEVNADLLAFLKQSRRAAA